MTSPTNAVTLDDSRYYVWPGSPGVHFPSITTIIKEGVPKPFLPKWATRTAAELTFSDLDLLVALRERARGNG